MNNPRDEPSRNRLYQFFAAMYLGGLLVLVGWWVWILTWTAPTVSTGVTFANALTSYVLLGVNAWFLKSLLAQIAVAREANALVRGERDEATSPHLEIGYGADDLRLLNHGQAVARGIVIHRVRYEDGLRRIESASCRSLASADWSKVVFGNGSVTRTEFDGHEIYIMVSCRDPRNREHVRWFQGSAEVVVPGLELPSGAPRPIGDLVGEDMAKRLNEAIDSLK